MSASARRMCSGRPGGDARDGDGPARRSRRPTGVVSLGDGYAVKANEPMLDYVLDGMVGTVQLGAPCDELRRMGSTDYYAINRAKYVTWTTNRRPKTVVVQCGVAP